MKSNHMNMSMDSTHHTFEQPDQRATLEQQASEWQCRGQLQVEQGQYAQAQESYFNALLAYENIVEHTPNDVRILMQQGLLYKALVELEEDQPSSCRSYMRYYDGALAAFAQVREVAPNDLECRRQLGEIWTHVADLDRYRLPADAEFELDEGGTPHMVHAGDVTEPRRKAIAGYFKALQAFREGLALNPDDLHILQARGLVWAKLGQQLSTGEHDDVHVKLCFREALSAVQEVRHRDPDSSETLTMEACIHEYYGSVLCSQWEYEKALESQRRVVDIYDDMLRQKPDDPAAYCNKAKALDRYASIMPSNDEGEARRYEQAVLACYERAEALAPDDAHIRSERESIQFRYDLKRQEM